jgi:hypothetical protein
LSCKILAASNVGEIKGQQGDQNKDAAQERKEEELDSRILPARAAPNADQEVHGQQHHFPKHIKQEEIQGEKRPDHARFQNQK